MLREGIGLEIDRALKGEVKERTLQVSCLTDPACEQFEATGQEVVAFISALPRDGGGHLRPFKTIPGDQLNEAAAEKLAALTPGPWGETESGLACRLLGPGDEISAAGKALFSVFMKVVQAEPVTKEVSVMAEIAADRSEGVLALHGGGARREVIALERTPGLYLITHRALTVFHKGERVARRDSYGTGTGGTSYLSGLSQNCIDRHELKLVVDIRIWESSRFGKGYSHRRPDQPVLWKKKLEKTLPSVMSDQPMYGDWGEQENGLRSRLILSHQSVRKADEPFLFLDVRNDSGKPVTLFGGKGMAANLAVIGPDGKRVKALMSFVPEDIGWWNVSEGKESNSLALVMKKAFSLERPGDYRIEWKGGKVEGHQKEPDADRTFRYPPKAPPVSLRIE